MYQIKWTKDGRYGATGYLAVYFHDEFQANIYKTELAGLYSHYKLEVLSC